MSAASLTMLLDVAPPTLDPDEMKDYGAQFVAAALYPPLIDATRDDRAPRALARVVEADADRRLVHLRLGERRWSDGRDLVADDVLRSWRAVEAGNGVGSSLLRLLLGDASVDEACSSDGTGALSIRLRPGGMGILGALASVSLSPRDEDRPAGTVLGPFRVAGTRTDLDELALVRNPHSVPAGPARPVERIELAVERDPERGVEDWLAGRCDVTSNTMFPAHRAADPELAPYLDRTPTPLRGVVRIDPAWTISSGIEPEALAAAVPRREIVQMLHGCVSAEAGYWDDDPVRRDPDPAAPSHPAAVGSRSLRLAVADFYPNVLVCERIAESWRGLGVDVVLDVVDYHALADARSTHDATYEIWGLPFPDVRSRLLALDLRSPDAGARVRGARQRLATGRPVDGDDALLSDHLHRQVHHVPVLAVHSIMAVAPHVGGFAIDALGRPRFDDLTLSGARRRSPKGTPA
ncbi:MAG: hypothetical protein ACRCY8_12915 [Dermatophilaceae bacterium]